MEDDGKGHDRIELRSEKVRKILGEIPRSLVVWGYIVLAVTAAGLIVLLRVFPQFFEQLTKKW